MCHAGQGSASASSVVLLIILKGLYRLRRQWEQCDHVKDGHEAYAEISDVPHEGIGCQAADIKHDQGKNLIQSLGQPVVSKKIGHIGAGVEQDADKGREAEKPEDCGDKDDAEIPQMMVHGGL